MTTHISKDELALMMPGMLYHYFKDEPEYRVPTPPVRPSVFVRLAAALADWMQRRAERQELASLSDAQLADIGISRAEAGMVFDPHFAARHKRERLVARTQTGRIATV